MPWLASIPCEGFVVEWLITIIHLTARGAPFLHVKTFIGAKLLPRLCVSRSWHALTIEQPSSIFSVPYISMLGTLQVKFLAIIIIELQHIHVFYVANRRDGRHQSSDCSKFHFVFN